MSVTAALRTHDTPLNYSHVPRFTRWSFDWKTSGPRHCVLLSARTLEHVARDAYRGGAANMCGGSAGLRAWRSGSFHRSSCIESCAVQYSLRLKAPDLVWNQCAFSGVQSRTLTMGIAHMWISFLAISLAVAIGSAVAATMTQPKARPRLVRVQSKAQIGRKIQRESPASQGGNASARGSP